MMLVPCVGSRDAEKPKIVRILIWVLVLHLLALRHPYTPRFFSWCQGEMGADGMSDRSTPLKR